MVTADTKALRGLTKALRELADAVLLHLRNLDTEMKQPSSVERGRRIAACLNRLEMANDSARYFGLGTDFRKDPESKARETKRAGRAAADPIAAALADGEEHGYVRGVAAERARIRRELRETLHTWTAGAHPNSLKAAVAADLLAALDRIAPEEG